jgi:UDPglucose--hexose-1-phosphate uridylyltransferase
VRVVPNKFPVIPEEEGIHEVVVPTSRHVVALAELTEQEMSRATRVWALRLEEIAADPRGLWPFCFLNQGAAAGASLQHTHAQIVGLPVEPPRLLAIERTFAGSDPVAADLDTADSRLVAQEAGFAAWCPAVPPFTGTLRIASREAETHLTESTDFDALGRLLLEVVTRVDSYLGAPSLNLLVHQRRPGGPGAFHWHIDLVPRLGTLAGLELGTGVIAIAQAPEAVAARLRGE